MMIFFYPPQNLHPPQVSHPSQYFQQQAFHSYQNDLYAQGDCPRLPPTEPRAHRLHRIVDHQHQTPPPSQSFGYTPTSSASPTIESSPSTDSGYTSPSFDNFAFGQAVPFTQANTKPQPARNGAPHNFQSGKHHYNKPKHGGKTHSKRRKEIKMADPNKVIRSRRFYPPTLERDPINIFQVPSDLHAAMNIWVSVIPEFQGQEKIKGPPMAMTSNRVGALWRVHCVFIDDDKGLPPKARDVRKEMEVAMETLKVALAPEYEDYKGDYLVEVLEEMIAAIEATL